MGLGIRRRDAEYRPTRKIMTSSFVGVLREQCGVLNRTLRIFFQNKKILVQHLARKSYSFCC